MNRLLTALIGLTFIVSLNGCKAGPNYKRPVINTPADYRGGLAPDIASTPTGTPLGAEKYTTVFTDPVLQALIAEALKNNFDVKIAADRVLEEKAAVGVARAGEFPTLTGGGSYDAVSLPAGLLGGLDNSNSSNSSSSTNNGRTNVYSGGLTASAAWNLDFWGYYRRMTEAQRAEYRATTWAQQTTYATIVEDVATDYYQLRALDAQLAITKQTIQTRQQSVDLNNKLETGGNTSLADVRQAEELLYTAKAELPDLQRQIEQQENNLGLLLGRNPGTIIRDTDASADILAHAAHPVEVPVGLPSELLERRPDVRRAEELLVQANANIDYYAVGSLSQPIFDAGKIRNNYREAQAKDQELIHTYQQTIAGAFRDVSNALAAYSRSREYREQQEKQTEASADAVRLARIRYTGGATSYLEVLTNDANLYSSQLTLETAQQQEALALVQLYNALGGGW